MAIFRKNTTTTNIPELQEYYANQKRESSGLAWLLAIGSLLVTAAVIIGLFVGGRWLYRKVNDKDTSTTVTTVEPVPSSNNGSSSSTGFGSGSTATPAPTTTPAQGVSPNQSPSTNSSAVAAATTVPETGAGNTIVVFMAIIVVAYMAHRTYLLKKIGQ